MDTLSSEIVIQTRSKTSNKDIKKMDSKFPISNNAKNSHKKYRMNKKAGGIIYIGHIPHGFYEDEMKSYFNQFGTVVATTVARSKKTGRSKGYGFIEFKDEEVAKIAAETMNNYLMFNRILKCRYIPPEENRGRIIERKISAFNYPRQRNRKINEQQKAKAFSGLTQSTYREKAEAKINKFKKFFEERGIDFSFQLKYKDDADDELGVLEIDESDSEIDFKTPPQVKKVIKKSLKSPTKAVTEFYKPETGKQKVNTVKKPDLKIAHKKGKIEKKTTKTSTATGKKATKNMKNSLKAKEFLVKDIYAMAKQKKEKIGGNAGVATRTTQKKNAKQRSEICDKTVGGRKNKIKISVKAEI